MSVIVYTAVQLKSGLVGYFEEKEAVPSGFKLCVKPEIDIAEVMNANHWSKERALKVMNGPWQR